jgi:serine/threonine protein kinase
MSLETIRTCPQCHRPLPAHAPEGLCPQCLMKAAGSLQSEPQGAGDTIEIGDPAAVGKCLPQFEVLELLGRGGMGVVYKARQRNLDRLVALKILPPTDALATDFVERFTREARSLAKLSHPNIVTVYEFGESGGLYYFVMELVDGVNLREMIRTGKMKPEEALAVVPKICDALQFAHEEGVVHRDVKPENILIDKRGRVKIADFGLAKLLRREQSDHTLTMTGMTLGTPRYMAPEQLDKPETVDHRADIYSLGVVFYEMLTGEIPMGRFAPPSEKVRIDVRLDEIVLHALERDVERRYQHVSQVREDVENVTSKPGTWPQSPSTPPQASAGIPHGHPWLVRLFGGTTVALLGILSALLGVGVGIFALSGPGTGNLSPGGLKFFQWVAVPAYALTMLGVLALVFTTRAGKSASRERAIVWFVLVALGIGAGALPWFAYPDGVSGWRYGSGTYYSLLFVALGLFLLVTGGAKAAPAWHSWVILISGIAAFVIAWHFVAYRTSYLSPGQQWDPSTHPVAGLYLAVATGVLTATVGAMQLRQVFNSTSQPATTGTALGSMNGEPRIRRLALWGTISVAALVVGIWIFYLANPAAFRKGGSQVTMETGALAPGTRVAAWWNAGVPILNGFYIATIMGTDASGSYFVRYGDGDSGLVPPKGIVPVDAARELPIGTQVLACWKGAAMYPGIITQRRENLYTVQWSDGDAPLDVPRANIAPVDRSSPGLPLSSPPKSQPKTKP